MRKVLLAYFPIGGTTAKAAKDLAAAEGANLFEISPELPYVRLIWTTRSLFLTVGAHS